MEEEEESNDEPAKHSAKKQTFPSLWNQAVRFGKTVAVAGAAIASAPLVIPPAVVGFAFSVPFGVYFAGLVYTENVMRALFLSNCQCEIVENQDVQIVLQDKDTSPTSLCYSDANLEEVEIKSTSQDGINEKYYDGGTYANTKIVLHDVQEDENKATLGSDERNEDDICIYMQPSQDGKCDSDLPLSSSNAECGDMIFPVHLEEAALGEAGCKDLENQHASENVNDRNPDAEICYEEQEKLSELQQHGCDSGIEALGLNEALHKLDERSSSAEGDIKEDVHFFRVAETLAEMKGTVTRKDNESMNEDYSKRNYIVEAYDEEMKNLSDLQQHGCGLGIKALALDGALHKSGERSISDEDDTGEDVGHSFNAIEPRAEMDSVTIKDGESINEEYSNEGDSNSETYNEQKKNLSTLDHRCSLRIEELGSNEALHEMDVHFIEEDGTDKCTQEPLVANEERDISNDVESMNKDIELNDQNLDSMVLTDDPRKEECAFEDETSHKMESRGSTEKDGTNECSNRPFVVLESPVEKEEKYISDNEEPMNIDMKLNHQELDPLDLKDDPGNEECAAESDGKLKDEVDEANETTVPINVSTGGAESEHGSAHVFGGDDSHSGTNQSTGNELNKFKTEVPMLDEQIGENEGNVIDENGKGIEIYAFLGQPSDGYTETTTIYKPDDQSGDEQLCYPVHFDKVTGEVEHERDNTSAKIDTEHLNTLRPNPNEEKIHLKKDEIGEGCYVEIKIDDMGQTDYIELRSDTIMDIGKEEVDDTTVSTEMSDEHPKEIGSGEALQNACTEFEDDMNWDASKEKEETPMLTSIKTKDEMSGNIEDNEEMDVNIKRRIDEVNWGISKGEEETPLLVSIETEDEIKGRMEDNEGTDDSIDPKKESSDNMFDLTDAMDDSLIPKGIDNQVKVQEETNEDQPKTSYLYAAVMPKEVESEIVDHKNEKGTVVAKQEEITGDGCFIAKDGKSRDELPTVPEEREVSFEFPDSSSEKTMESQPKTYLVAELNIDESSMVKGDESVGDLPTVPLEQKINFEVPCLRLDQTLWTNLNIMDENVEDSGEGELDALGDETKGETTVETKETLASMESENENVESSISIAYVCGIGNHSSDITSAESRVDITVAGGSDVVHFHDEVIYSEDAIWEQIAAFRAIIGCKAEMQSTLTDELKALYVLIGVEPPAFLEETSDLIEVTEKLEFLKSVIGVK